MQREIPNHVAFYVSSEHDTFLTTITNDLTKLNKLKINWRVFTHSDVKIPRMCTDGYCVAGFVLIKKQLANIISVK